MIHRHESLLGRSTESKVIETTDREKVYAGVAAAIERFTASAGVINSLKDRTLAYPERNDQVGLLSVGEINKFDLLSRTSDIVGEGLLIEPDALQRQLVKSRRNIGAVSIENAVFILLKEGVLEKLNPEQSQPKIDVRWINAIRVIANTSMASGMESLDLNKKAFMKRLELARAAFSLQTNPQLVRTAFSTGMLESTDLIPEN